MMINEMYRVLKPGGAYVCVSYGVPATRMGYLQTPTLDWNVSHSKIRKLLTLQVPFHSPHLAFCLAKPVVEGYDEMGADTNHYIYFCVKPE
jgi:ubiquinone/menaquinone biosynthesis C-methylase UbiE